MAAPQKTRPHPNPQTETGTLFGRRVFEDVMKALEMRSSWIFQAGPKANDTCLYETEKVRRRYRGCAHGQTEAETG